MSKIYTKTGDDGTTWCGSRVSKAAPICEAVGTLDELNASLGVVMTLELGGTAYKMFHAIQHDLFEIGGEVAFGRPSGAWAGRMAEMEAAIDEFTEKMPPLTNFVLPGGSQVAAHLHHARTVCRRAERRVVVIEGVRGEVFVYLNRLSDLLFTYARWANGQGRFDTVWRPAKPAEGGTSAA